MVQILGITGLNVIAAKATKSISENDYRKLLPILINKLKHQSEIRLYFEVADYDDQDPETFCGHLKFDGCHASALDRVALVGNYLCEQLLPKFGEIFQFSDVRFFLPNQKEDAIAWINGKDNPAEKITTPGIKIIIKYEAGLNHRDSL